MARKRGRKPKLRPEAQIISSPTPGIIQANPQDDYTARSDGGWVSLRSALTRLPTAVDDLDVELGADIKGKMMQDPQINSAVYILAMAAMTRGLNINPRIQDIEDPLYEKAKEIAEFCERNLEYLENPLSETLLDITVGALVYGNCIAEQKYKLLDYGVDAGKLVLDSIKPKAQDSVAFVVDQYDNLKGIAAYTGSPIKDDAGKQVVPIFDLRGRALDNYTVEGLDWGWKVFPKEKFCYLTFRKRNNDIRGSSALRAAYNPWYLKVSLYVEWLKFLVRFASPSLIGVLPQNARDVREEGSTLVRRAIDVLYEKMAQFENGSILAVPFGTEIDVLFSQGDGQAFLQAFSNIDKQIVKSILHQLLATEEGKFMSRSSGQVHQDVMNIAVRNLQGLITAMFRSQVLRNLVRLNYGEEFIHLTPFPTLGETAPEDQATLMTAMASLLSAGGIHESQLRGWDSIVGAPYRIEAEYGKVPSQVQAAEMQEQVQEAAAEAADKAQANAVEVAKNTPAPVAGNKDNKNVSTSK